MIADDAIFVCVLALPTIINIKKLINILHDIFIIWHLGGFFLKYVFFSEEIFSEVRKCFQSERNFFEVREFFLKYEKLFFFGDPEKSLRTNKEFFLESIKQFTVPHFSL